MVFNERMDNNNILNFMGCKIIKRIFVMLIWFTGDRGKSQHVNYCERIANNARSSAIFYDSSKRFILKNEETFEALVHL